MHRNVSAKLPACIGDMANLNRRSFLTLTGAAGLSAALDIPAFGQPNEASAKATSVRDFTFLFITDTHLEPELNAAQGCDQCFKKARTIKSDFAIQGGDHVFDSLAVGRERANSVFDLLCQDRAGFGIQAPSHAG